MFPLLLRIGALPAAATAGFKGLLAFWAGGAAVEGAVVPPVVEQQFIGDGIDYAKLEKNRQQRERKAIDHRDDLTRIVRNAFQKVTGEPEPVAPVAAKIERKVAKEAIRAIRLEGLDGIEASMAAVQQLIREYEAATAAAAIAAKKQADDNDALALLLLAS